MVMENPKYMLHRPLSDMEDNGVYFDPHIKELLVKKREEEICQYSGLPSVMSYSSVGFEEPPTDM
jgi:hypothetical protein